MITKERAEELVVQREYKEDYRGDYFASIIRAESENIARELGEAAA